MGLSIDDLVRPVTEDQIFETFLDILETLQIPARSWRRGGVARTILRVVARTYSGFTELMAAAIKSGFLESAEGDWLTLLARHVYGVERIGATFATGQIEFSNGGGGVFNFNAGEVRVISTSTRKAYTNAAAFVLNPGETKTVDFVAVEQGAASSAPPRSIVELETVLPRVTITNPAALVGTDAETDPDLRQRCRDRLGALGPRGPRSAYAYAVRSARRPNGAPVSINRVSISPSSSTGEVTIYAASPSGAPIESDLTVARRSIEDIARPDTVTATLLPAFETPLTASLVLWAKRTNGVTANDIATLAQNALIREISTYPIGGIRKTSSSDGKLYADFVKGVAKSAHTTVFDVDGFDSDLVVVPGGVVTLAATVEVRLVDAEAA